MVDQWFFWALAVAFVISEIKNIVLLSLLRGWRDMYYQILEEKDYER